MQKCTGLRAALAACGLLAGFLALPENAEARPHCRSRSYHAGCYSAPSCAAPVSCGHSQRHRRCRTRRVRCRSVCVVACCPRRSAMSCAAPCVADCNPCHVGYGRRHHHSRGRGCRTGGRRARGWQFCCATSCAAPSCAAPSCAAPACAAPSCGAPVEPCHTGYSVLCGKRQGRARHACGRRHQRVRCCVVIAKTRCRVDQCGCPVHCRTKCKVRRVRARVSSCVASTCCAPTCSAPTCAAPSCGAPSHVNPAEGQPMPGDAPMNSVEPPAEPKST